jgi:leucyl aminopeptidase
MAGGALMIAVMSALQELGVPVKVTGPVVAAENMRPARRWWAGRRRRSTAGKEDESAARNAVSTAAISA